MIRYYYNDSKNSSEKGYKLSKLFLFQHLVIISIYFYGLSLFKIILKILF
jgi:hypothetical protein